MASSSGLFPLSYPCLQSLGTCRAMGPSFPHPRQSRPAEAMTVGCSGLAMSVVGPCPPQHPPEVEPGTPWHPPASCPVLCSLFPLCSFLCFLQLFFSQSSGPQLCPPGPLCSLLVRYLYCSGPSLMGPLAAQPGAGGQGGGWESG